jgi:general secretion pathway protein D
VLCLSVAFLLVSGCAGGPKIAHPQQTPDGDPASNQAPAAAVTMLPGPSGASRTQPTLVPGTGVFTRDPRAPQPHDVVGSAPGVPGAAGGLPAAANEPPPDVKVYPAQDQLQLSFVDTEIGVVVSSVLGDGLGVSFVIDPSIKGTMTLQASRALSREEVLPALENALRLYGIAMVEEGGTYDIVPIVDARRRVLHLRQPGDGSPGFGIQVVTPQYVSASDIEKTLRSVAPDGAIVRVDEGRNLLLLAGTSQERAGLLDMIKTFDVDWLAGMSFAVFPFEYLDAKTAADELSHVFSEEKSPIANVVRFIPLTRLNALLVVSYQPHYLQEIETWIHRLDVGTSSAGRRIYVYDVQNGKADELAKSLADVLSLAYSSAATTSIGSSSLSSSPQAQGNSNLSGSQSVSTTGTGGISGSGSGAGSGYGSSSGYGFSSGYDDRSASDRTNGSSRAATASRTAGGNNSGMSISANLESNSLMILATPSEFAMVEGALKHLDVPPLEVMIDATLAEVTLTDQLRFGVQWSYLTKQGPVGFSEASTGGIAQQFPGLSFLYTGNSSISAVLSSLETFTRVKVLSSPKLLVLNNREAELKIGDQVPVITQSAVSTVTSDSTIVNSVQLMDTGVILRVVPRVNKNGLVTLEISQEVSDVGATTTSTINSPTIHQRQMSSTVEVRDGETIALGGLIRESISNARDGLPFLSRIPGLGALFGSTSNEKDRTELVVLITPRVIRSSDDGADLMDDLRTQFKALRDVMPPRPTPTPGKTARPDANKK